MKTPLKNKLNSQLLAFRKEIDKADADILRALSRRLRVVEKIGIIKLQNKMPLIQKTRWKKLVADRVFLGKKVGLRSAFTKVLMDLIHLEAIAIQWKQRKKKSVNL